MGRKCSVWGCFGNYDADTKCTVYSFPTDIDERQEWIDALPNNTKAKVTGITKYMGICQFHWPPNAPMKKSLDILRHHLQPPFCLNKLK